MAFLTGQPIVDQAPLFRKLAEHPRVDLTVYFCWDTGAGEVSFDKQFGVAIRWGTPLLGGYLHKFLRNFSLKPSDSFWGQVNFGIIVELFRNRYDAIVIHGWNSFTYWLVFLVAPVLGVDIFLRGENPFNQEILKSSWNLRIKRVVLGWLFRRVSAFLYLGEENKKFYEYYGVPAEKLFFTPYAVENDRFFEQAQLLRSDREKLKKEMGLSPESVTILFMGKLIDKKRPFDAVKALEILASSFPNLRLLMVGDGSLRPALAQYITEKNLRQIELVGFKNQTEIPRYYAVADIFVLPSGPGETWGLVVNEAMNFGLPIVISDIVGCGPDLVRDGKNGYRYPIGNIEALAKSLEKLIESKERREAFGIESLEKVQEYSYKKDIEGILEALDFSYDGKR